MPDPVQAESLAAKNQNFAEEASFFAALFKHHSVKPMPDPGLILVLTKQWLDKKERQVTKKAKSEQLWFGQKPEDDDPDDLYKDEEF
ncbi:hypothetical protein [Endozoicomonas sp.]|uniref:hypothetical protein n=1 Tax=Endozoicomonas sp. TaxID=1892382 RepID=UPI00383AC17A